MFNSFRIRKKVRGLLAITVAALTLMANSGSVMAGQIDEEISVEITDVGTENQAEVEYQEEVVDLDEEPINDVSIIDEPIDKENNSGNNSDTDSDNIDSATIEYDEEDDYEVLGVTANFASNSSVEYDVFVNWRYRKLADGNYAVVDCPYTGSEIDVPAEWHGIPVTTIASNCSNGLSRLHITPQVTTICDNAFYGNTSIWYIQFKPYSNTQASSLTTIGDYAFYGMTGLTEIDMSGTKVATIGKEAFKNCNNIKSFKFPNTITYIAADAFNGCTSLTSVTVVRGSYADTFFTNNFSHTGIAIKYYDGSISQETEETDTQPVYEFAGCSALFDGNIGLRCYFKLNIPAYNENSSLKVMLPDSNGWDYQEVYYNKSEMAKVGDYYVCTIYLDPKVAVNPIYMQFEQYRQAVSDFYEVSLPAYISAFIQSSSDSYKIRQAKAIMSYCSAVEYYFNGYSNTSSYYKRLMLSDNELATVDLSNYAPTINDSELIGMSLSLDHDIKLNIYFVGEYDSLKISKGSAVLDSTANIKSVNGYTVFECGGFVFGNKNSVYPKIKMDEVFMISPTASIEDSPSTFTRIYGLYSYLYLATQQGNDRLKNLAYSIYYLNEYCFSGSNSDVMKNL